MSEPTLLGGRYRLDEPIGRGGMASVWRATDTVLGRAVAVKRLHASLASDDELTERFRREALMVARLSHPHLVHVLDRGEDAEGAYLVMELVEGETLKDRVRRRGPLEPAEAARICAEVARALHHAHEQGVVHRDIKAQNVLLGADDSAKVADFGIARMIEADAGAGLTRTDMLLGSADYLSPEQANGHALDARSDIYSLGIVLFECLTATLPFTGEGFVAVAMKHCSEPLPDPRTVVGSTPEWLAAIVVRATQKDPDLRFADAAAMAAALEAGETGIGIAAMAGGTAVMPAVVGEQLAAHTEAVADTATRRRPRRPTRRRRRIAGAALALTLVLGGAAGAGIWMAQDRAGGNGAPTTGVQGDERSLMISSVRDLDPEELGGDGVENPELRDLAIDGDPETAWYTERYQDSAAFGGLKDGVGLLLRLAGPSVVTEVQLDSPTPGATFEVQAMAQGSERVVLAEGTFTGESQRVVITTDGEPVEAQNYILWITSLVPTDDGRFHAGVSEVRFRGVPLDASAETPG